VNKVISKSEGIGKRFGGARKGGELESIDFSSTLVSSLRPELEKLFFFNPLQRSQRRGILEALEQTGTPAVMQSGERIWIGTPAGDTQCLFACGIHGTKRRLLGAVLFGRPAPDLISIWHIAVGHEGIGRNQRIQVGSALIEKVREAARSIKGVAKVRLPYRGLCVLSVQHPVKA